MSSRVPATVLLIGAVLLGLLFDRIVEDDEVTSSEATPVDASVFPVASEPGAFSSTWFCAGGTANEESFADHDLLIANPTGTAVEVSVTAFAGVVAPPAVQVDPEDLDPSDEGSSQNEDDAGDDDASGEPVDPASLPDPTTVTVEVAPQSRERVELADLVQAPVASALVEAAVGGIVVEHEVSSIHGFDAKPCATAAASEWHFAWGDTSVDARQLLVLFNPFPQDAIVDGRFSTDDGVREPVRFDGFVVPGRGTVAVDLGDDVTRRSQVSASLRTRSGRIVVDRVLRINSETERGLTVQLGVPEPQRTWVFPDGFLSEEVREEYVVYNPGEDVAEATIEFVVDDPESTGIPAPVELSLPPGSHQVIDLNEDGRVPADVGHSAIVRSANDVPLVAERVVSSDREGRRGVTVTTGSPVEAETWTFAAGAASDSTDEFLVLVNLDSQILAEVSVDALVGGQRLPVADLQEIELLPGQRRVIPLDESTDSETLPLQVRSTEPIVAERGFYRVGEDERGMSNAIGVPSAAGLRMPADPLEAQGPTDLGDGDADEGPGGEEETEVPDDVELPDPDETIVIDDPDAEAEDPVTTTTSSSTTEPPDDQPPDASP